MTNTDIYSTTSGFFPRPKNLIEAAKEIEGLQKDGMETNNKNKISNIISKSREKILNLQTKAGIDLPTEGQLVWDDLLAHPFTKLKGAKMEGLIRYYNTNRFYRRPKITGKLKRNGTIIHDEIKNMIGLSKQKIKPLLPGPITMKDLAEDEFYKSEKHLIEDLSKIIIKEINELEDTDIIQLDEPSLAYNPVKEFYLDAIRYISDSTKHDVIVQTYFGQINDIYPKLLDSVDGIGLDLFWPKNWEAIKEHGCPKKLNAGCINSHNTKIEKYTRVAEKISKLIDGCHLNTLYVCPNYGLDFLPWSKMLDKIKLLEKIKNEVKSR